MAKLTESASKNRVLASIFRFAISNVYLTFLAESLKFTFATKRKITSSSRWLEIEADFRDFSLKKGVYVKFHRPNRVAEFLFARRLRIPDDSMGPRASSAGWRRIMCVTRFLSFPIVRTEELGGS